MSAVVAITAAVAIGLSLVASGFAHLTARANFHETLLAQEVVPVRLAAPMGLVLPILELGLGAIVLTNMTFFYGEAIMSWSLLAATMLFLAMAVYLVRASPGSECGCGYLEMTVGPIAVVRTVVLASLAALGAAISWSRNLESVSSLEAVESVIAGACLAILVNGLPVVWNVVRSYRKLLLRESLWTTR